MVPKFLFLIFPLLAVLGGVPALGLEMEVLSPTMTRQEADDYLTKDYVYRVLEDGSVRRTWSPDANSRLILDFDPKKGTLLSMFMEYRKPIAEEEAMKTLQVMTGKDKISWAKMPEDKMAKIEQRLIDLANAINLYLKIDSKIFHSFIHSCIHPKNIYWYCASGVVLSARNRRDLPCLLETDLSGRCWQ